MVTIDLQPLTGSHRRITTSHGPLTLLGHVFDCNRTIVHRTHRGTLANWSSPNIHCWFCRSLPAIITLKKWFKSQKSCERVSSSRSGFQANSCYDEVPGWALKARRVSWKNNCKTGRIHFTGQDCLRHRRRYQLATWLVIRERLQIDPGDSLADLLADSPRPINLSERNSFWQSSHWRSLRWLPTSSIDS